MMACREEILDCVTKLVNQRGINQFTVEEVVKIMADNETRYKVSTIRTHITSRMCKNAPQNHQVKYQDFERIDHGLYRLISH